MDKKLFKKTYKYICSSCGKFSHTHTEYCESCGGKNTMREAFKEDFKKHENEK
jgi:rRNA maturation endonuclease Nob1